MRRSSDMESVHRIPKVARATTVSTKRPKTKRKLKKLRATRKRAATMMSAAGSEMSRTLFFFNVPAWITDYEELIMLFQQVRKQKRPTR